MRMEWTDGCTEDAKTISLSSWGDKNELKQEKMGHSGKHTRQKSAPARRTCWTIDNDLGILTDTDVQSHAEILIIVTIYLMVINNSLKISVVRLLDFS